MIIKRENYKYKEKLRLPCLMSANSISGYAAINYKSMGKIFRFILCLSFLCVASVDAFAYTVAFDRSFPIKVLRDKSFEIESKSKYERARQLKDMMLQNLKDQDTVVKNDKDGSGYNAFIKLLKEYDSYYAELKSILGL